MGLFDPQMSYKPNKYPWTQDIINASWAGFWTPNEFNFVGDKNQFHNELDPFEQQLITRNICAIGQIEVAVKTFWPRLGNTLPHPGMMDMGLVLANQEVIHNQAYTKLLDVVGLDKAFEEVLKEKVIAGRVDYLRKYNTRVYEDQRKQFVYALTLFTGFVEDTSLFSQFYIISYFNKFRNVLKDTAQQVQYTRQEETLHAKAGKMIINTLRQEYPELFDEELKQRIIEECHVALFNETKVIQWILRGYQQPNLSEELLVEYVKDRINKFLIEIGFDPIFPVDTNLLRRTEWMDEGVKGKTRTDFFHKKPTDYSKGTRNYERGSVF